MGWWARSTRVGGPAALAVLFAPDTGPSADPDFGSSVRNALGE
jgi:hypothetical protein